MPVISGLALAYLLVQGDLTEKGIDEFRKGQYTAAAMDLQNALKANPRDEHARAFLSMTKAATRDCTEAAAEFQRSPNPDLARMSGLGAVECYAGSKKDDDSFALLRELRTRFPADSDVLYETAKLHRAAWDRAVYEMFQKAAGSYRVNQLSAEVFETEGKYGEAIAQYRKAIEKAPEALNLHFRLGRCLLLESPTTENLEQAKAEFEAELSLSPNDAAAEYEIGQILSAQGKPAQAIPHYQRALEIRPDFVEAIIAVGKSQAAHKDYSGAARLFERAVTLQPDNEPAHYNLMLAYRNSGNTEGAALQKKELDRLMKPPEGEFSDFLKKLGEKAPER